MITIKTHKVGMFIVIEPAGFLCDEDASFFKSEVNRIINQGHHDLAICMDRVKGISSHALGSLIQVWKTVTQKKGSMYLICAQSNLIALFDSYNLQTLFAVFKTEEEFTESVVNQRSLSLDPGVRDRADFKIVDILEPFGIMAEPGHLNDLFAQLFDCGSVNIAVNLNRIEYIYSVILGLFIKWVNRLQKANGHFCVFNVDNDLRDRFVYAGLDKVIQIYDHERNIPFKQAKRN